MQKKYYDLHLDGLRGIAILLVILYHYFTGFGIFDFGWSGVDLFFVLSGYLLTGRLYPYLNDKKLLIKFYVNRILRIVPLYFLFLILFFSLLFILGSEDTIRSFSFQTNHIPAFFCYTINWIFIAEGTHGADHLNHLWSLAIEEQFYLVFPLLVIFLTHKKTLFLSGIILTTVVFICRCIYYNYVPEHQNILFIYWNSFFRADAFLTGFVLYMAIENNFLERLFKYYRIILLGTAVIIAAGCIYSGSMRVTPFFVTVGFTAVAFFYACFIIAILSPKNNLIKKVTSLKFLRDTGKISFGLYIFHWPVFLTGFTAIHFIPDKLNIAMSPDLIQMINALFSFLFSYIISRLSFKYFESLFLKWKLQPGIPVSRSQEGNDSSLHVK